MIKSTDPAEFYSANLRNIDRFLASKGIQDPADRSDICHTFMLDALVRDTLNKADSCGNFESYINRSLHNHVNQFYRDKYHDGQVPGDYTLANCFSDASNTPNSLYIHDFTKWADCPTVDRAVDAMLTDEEGSTRSSDYRIFQRYRNRYRDEQKSGAK